MAAMPVAATSDLCCSLNGLTFDDLQVDTDMCRSVRAAMGVPEKDRSKGLLKADDSAQRVLKLVDTLDMTNTGTFWAADTGEVLAW
jgi:hypothetical protein